MNKKEWEYARRVFSNNKVKSRKLKRIFSANTQSSEGVIYNFPDIAREKEQTYLSRRWHGEN